MTRFGGGYLLWIILAVIFAAIYFFGTSITGGRKTESSSLRRGTKADGE